MFLTLKISSVVFAFEIQNTEKSFDVAFYEAGYFYSKGEGIDKDVIEELKKRGNYLFNYIELPLKRLWHNLENGTLPISVSGLSEPKRDKYVWFIPYIAQRSIVITTNKKFISPNVINSVRNAKVGVWNGFLLESYYENILRKVELNKGVVKVIRLNSLFKMLVEGERFDLIITIPVFFRKALKEIRPSSPIYFYDWNMDQKPSLYGIVLSKKYFSRNEFNRMKKIVEKMKSDGTLKRIFSKYLSKDEVQKSLDF